MSERLAVFAYGSLVAAESAARTLGRPVPAAPSGRLDGFTRNWSLARDNLRSEKTFERPDGSVPPWCLGLNVVAGGAGPAPNGALIEVTAVELERLDLREIRYHRLEVATAVVTADGGSHGYDSVTVYTARPENHRPEPPAGAVIIESYPRTIEEAFAGRGGDELALYRETTAPPPVELTPGRLVGDRIPEGNPRDW